MLWGLTCRLRQSVVARPSSWKPSASIWALGTVKNWLTTQFLIFASFAGVYSGASSVFGSLDGLAMTEFIVNRLKGAETRDWMSSRPALKKAILTNDMSMPHLVDVLANIIGVWPLIVSYLKETGCKDDGDSLVVSSSSSGRVGAFS